MENNNNNNNNNKPVLVGTLISRDFVDAAMIQRGHDICQNTIQPREVLQPYCQ